MSLSEISHFVLQQCPICWKSSNTLCLHSVQDYIYAFLIYKYAFLHSSLSIQPCAFKNENSNLYKLGYEFDNQRSKQ